MADWHTWAQEEQRDMLPWTFHHVAPNPHDLYPRIEIYGEHESKAADYLSVLGDYDYKVGTLLLYRYNREPYTKVWILNIGFAGGERWETALVKYFGKEAAMWDLKRIESNGWTTKGLY